MANVGRTPGTFHVSDQGAATYSIPIWAPKGPNGLEPHIALTYSSQSGSGYVGVGWNISGLSAVTRCNKTYAQDGTNAAPIQLQTSDGYCLDGQRLRLTSGYYGTAGSTYATEIDNFEQVTAESAAGNGPAYFEVKDRNGVTYEYGNGSSSQVLANGTTTAWQWWLDKVTDTAGNTLTIHYSIQNATSTVVPSDIYWTPSSHGATTYNYTMHFTYGTNSAQGSSQSYVDASAVSNSNLLDSISVSYSGTLVKEYFLSYQASTNTNKQELHTVKECADAAQSNCLGATTFSYYQDTQGNGVSSGSTTVNLGGTGNWYLTGYDVNGDGYRDLVFQVGTSWYVAFGSTGGYGSPINTGISTPQYAAGQPTLLAGDLLGNGQDGLLVNHSGTWYYYTWNGASFSGTSTGLAFNSSASAFALADTTGDGRPNLVELIIDASNTADVYIVPNTGSGSSPSFGSAVLAYSNTSGSGLNFVGAGLRGADSQHDAPITHLDFDGDGTDDLVLHLRWSTVEDINGKYKTIYINNSYQLLSHGMAFTGVSFAYNITYYFLNWNDSKCTDSIFGATLNIAACNGNAAATYTLPGNAIAAMDWDGSGRDDVLYASGSYIYVQPTTGTGLGTPYSTGILYNSADQYASADINNDGLDDLLTSTGSAITVNMHTGQGQPLDTLSEVQDGYGNTITPEYVSLAQGSGSTYTPGGRLQICSPFMTADCADTYVDTLYVVSHVTYSDPSNPPSGAYLRTHHYSQAMEDIEGRGFVGFATHSVTDSRNNLTEQKTFEQVFPYIFILTGDVITNNATGKTVTSLSNSPADTKISGTANEQVWFPYISGSTRKDYEVNGNENGDLVTTTSSSFAYDNYGSLTSSSKTVTDNDPGSPYYSSSWTTSVSNTPDEDPSTWCLPLLTNSQVTYSDTYDSSSITLTRQFTPDLTTCRYTQIVTAPNTNYQVTEGLGYDSFGNINTDTVTGTGMAAREIQTNWGSTGQFPLSVTDPTQATTNFNYDFHYGLVSSEADPNGLTTSWQYGDGFGRLTQETRPDGTYTTYTYNDCVNWGGCVAGAHTLALAHYNYNTDGTIENDGTTYFDELGRPVFWDYMMSSGTAWTQDEVRYDSLGRIAQRAAPCQWSGATTNACPYWSTSSYDVLNRLVEVQRPTNQSDSTPATTIYQYAGRTTTITDANGHTRTLVSDVNGWLRQNEDDLGYKVIFSYDAAGSRTRVTDNQADTLWTGTWAYGVAPFLTGESSMDRGAWGFTIDALGERTHWVDPKSNQFSASYDALSRPTTRAEPDLFTQWTWGTSATAHNIGKLQAVCTGTGTNPAICSSSGESETWSYDGDGRLYQRAITLPSLGTYTYSWQYNSSTGLPQSLTYPTGSSGKALTLQYTYANGYLQQITDTLDSPNIVVWQANTMNPAGQVTQDTLGNGIITSRAFDAVTHFLTSVQSGKSGGTSVQNLSFLYDAMGNVGQRQDNNLGLTENFYYDGDNRLSYSTLNGTQNLHMYYDGMGNITSRTDVANNAAWTYDPNHKHQVIEAGSTAYEYAYDANGNMTSRSGNSITWTSYNYPIAINDSGTGENVFFSYGPDRKPWAETTQEPSGTTTTYRLGSLMDIVVAGSGSTDRDYIFAGREPVAVDVPGNGQTGFHYFETDQQGSISAITDSSGQVTVNESFSAYGGRRNPSSWSGSPSSADLTTIAGITQHGYTFQRSLGEQMGLNNMVGRVQDAVTGRFISADPYVTDPETTQDWNPYSYVYNNPLTNTDPTGFQCMIESYPEDIWTITTGPFGNSLWVGTMSVSVPQCSGVDQGFDSRGGGAGASGGPAGGGTKDTSVTAKYRNQQKTDAVLSQCLANAAASIGRPAPADLNQTLEGLSATQAATDSAMKTLAGASAVSVGRTFAGFQSGMPAATNAAFADFGADVQSILQRSSPYVSGLGIGLSLYSVAAATVGGARSGGLSGAVTGFGYGSGDAILDFSLIDAFGPVGIPLAYGLDKIGGAQTLLSSAEYENAAQGCLGEAGIMAPPTP